MDVLEKALRMLEKYALCDHCLGRQFALLGHGLENSDRGSSIKLSLTLEANSLALVKNKEGVRNLKILATNGFSKTAEETLVKMEKRIRKKTLSERCFLCEDKFQTLEYLVDKAKKKIGNYEYDTFLVGITLPVTVEEREDEFKAEFNITCGESMKNEFGRTLGKKIAEQTGKDAEYKKPELVILVNPFTEGVKVQINPLFVAGRYTKLVRDLPQSKWFCSNCRGKGCEACDWTGKMYPESVEEFIAKPFLEETEGQKTSFHASGREDIDARMLGSGRPFVIEISKPKKRFLDLEKIEKIVNKDAQGKVKVTNLKFANKTVVRKLKKAESSQKEYRVLIEFEKEITGQNLHLLEEKLANAFVKQRTPLRVLHRRADLTREKHIYEVKLKELSPKTAEMKIRCQGGLYVKELVTGDEGRTTPSVSEFFNSKAKPIRLDVLKVIMDD